ncbi:MAG TPA: DUF4863 family protein [Burkholderiaceae bacterium]|jgi:hypothetical protein|nr:DUF4863 family protein [Burkholderiaceae bacterium]
MSNSVQEDFARRVAVLTSAIAGRALDDDLARDLNERHGPGSVAYESLAAACRAGVAEGWMCQREHGGIRFGRVLKATPRTHGFSVDVVDMDDIAGPHHRHPNGEIDLVMPLASGDGVAAGGAATFDGQSAGWKVYGPGSAHRPTVRGGRALVLYLLPDGAIEFTR